MFYIQRGYIRPLYIAEKITIPVFNFDQLVEEEKYTLNEYRFMIHRMVFSNSFDSRELLKIVVTYLKIILRIMPMQRPQG